MDKQDEALKLLKDIKNISHLIEQLQEQIEVTYTELTNTTVKPKEINVQVSLPSDPMAEKVVQLVEYQNELQEQQAELIAKKNTAIRVVKRLEIEEQQLLLYRYFKGLTIEQVADKMGFASYHWTWEKIHRAETSFIENY